MTFCVEPGHARKDHGVSELQLAVGASDQQTRAGCLPEEGTNQRCHPREHGRRILLSVTAFDFFSKT